MDTFLTVIMYTFLSGKAGIMWPFRPAKARPHHSDCGRAARRAGGYKSGRMDNSGGQRWGVKLLDVTLIVRPFLYTVVTLITFSSNVSNFFLNL